jgi:hypothetical protein
MLVRFPDRGFADAQLICKLLLGQSCTFAKSTVQNLFLNAPVGEFCQIWNACQFFHMSRWSRTRAVEPMTCRNPKIYRFQITSCILRITKHEEHPPSRRCLHRVPVLLLPHAWML